MTYDVPRQSEIEAISRELMEPKWRGIFGIDLEELRDLHHRAALMIARLERAWLERAVSATDASAI